MPVWLLLTLVCLTTFRVTRLLIQDAFPPIAVPRDHLVNWFDPDPDWIADHPKAQPHLGPLGRSLRYLATCPWCTSPYVAAGLIFGVLANVSVPLPWLWIATASAVTGLVHRNLDDS